MTELKTEREGVIWEMYFLTGHPLRMCHKGKHWNKTTQCVIKRCGVIVAIGEVVKHNNDVDNEFYAKRNSAMKAFSKCESFIYKETREYFWKEILKLKKP